MLYAEAPDSQAILASSPGFLISLAPVVISGSVCSPYADNTTVNLAMVIPSTTLLFDKQWLCALNICAGRKSGRA